MRIAWALVAIFCVATGARPCTAQTSAADAAAAQALFDEGKRLLDEGKPQAACPKLAESLRLDEAIGTRFQLARCYELTGRSASAWSLYLEVAAEARAAGQSEREAYARKKAKEIEPSLSRLKIVVPNEAREDGLSIKRNDVEVGPAQWGLPLPVDPGRYTVAVRAPGKRSWQVDVEIGGEGVLESVTIRRLADSPSEEKPAAAVGGALLTPQADAGPKSRRMTTWQWVGVGTAGAGVLSLGASGVFALLAVSKDNESNCKDGACPDEGSLAQNEDARSFGNLATVTLITGSVLVGAGAALFFMPPDRSSSGATAAAAKPQLWVGPTSVGIRGAF